MRRWVTPCSIWVPSRRQDQTGFQHVSSRRIGITGVKYFFASGKMTQGINDTAIVLILKKDDPDCLKDYMHISLCNVIYKIVSKCMVNRVRPLLQDIIAPTQSAFILGTMITDNALIAFECLHALKTGNRD
jgi:hypothetical protein